MYWLHNQHDVDSLDFGLDFPTSAIWWDLDNFLSGKRQLVVEKLLWFGQVKDPTVKKLIEGYKLCIYSELKPLKRLYELWFHNRANVIIWQDW